MAQTIGTPYAPGTSGAGNLWVNEVWDGTIDRDAQERAKLYPLLMQKKSLHGKMHVRKHAAQAVTTAAGNLDMTDGLTFAGSTETESTFTPSTVYLALSVNENQLDRMEIDPQDDMKVGIEMSIGAKIDTDVAGLFPSLSTNVVGTYAGDLDQSTILAAQALVEEGGKEYAEDFKIYFAYHHRQGDNIRSISPFISADIRGNGNSNAVSGQVIDVFGMKFVKTGNIKNSGGGFNNCAFIERAFAISFNRRIGIKTQDHGLGTWLLGRADYGYATIRDAYACLVKSKNT